MGKSIEAESRLEVTRAWGKGDRVSVWGSGKVLETDSGENCTTLCMYLMIQNRTPISG